MSTESMRNEGKGEELGGKIRAKVGKLLGNERMQAEGKAHELKGKAKQAIANAAEHAQSLAREGARGPGEALDDERTEEERAVAERDALDDEREAERAER